VVAARRGRGVRAVAVVVADGVELPRPVGVDAGVAALARVEPLGADELLVAHRGDEVLTGCALAVPAGDLLVGELGRRRVAGRTVEEAVGEAERLGPDAGVDVADDDALAGALDAAELLPQPARRIEPEECRCRGRIGRALLVGRDRQHAGRPDHRVGLRRRQLRGEAVVRIHVVVELVGPADLRDGRGVLALEEARVGDDRTRVRVDLLARLGGRGLEAIDAARVRHHGHLGHLDDVDAVLGELPRGGCLRGGGRRQHGQQQHRADDRGDQSPVHGPPQAMPGLLQTPGAAPAGSGADPGDHQVSRTAAGPPDVGPR
jgi:hypothetical protein